MNAVVKIARQIHGEDVWVDVVALAHTKWSAQEQVASLQQEMQANPETQIGGIPCRISVGLIENVPVIDEPPPGDQT